MRAFRFLVGLCCFVGIWAAVRVAVFSFCWFVGIRAAVRVALFIPVIFGLRVIGGFNAIVGVSVRLLDRVIV